MSPSSWVSPSISSSTEAADDGEGDCRRRVDGGDGEASVCYSRRIRQYVRDVAHFTHRSSFSNERHIRSIDSFKDCINWDVFGVETRRETLI